VQVGDITYSRTAMSRRLTACMLPGSWPKWCKSYVVSRNKDESSIASSKVCLKRELKLHAGQVLKVHVSEICDSSYIRGSVDEAPCIPASLTNTRGGSFAPVSANAQTAKRYWALID
jgi:hypothetical protein